MHVTIRWTIKDITAVGLWCKLFNDLINYDMMTLSFIGPDISPMTISKPIKHPAYYIVITI